MENFQGNAVVNYPSADISFTRIIEHKHFEFGTQTQTIITREYPVAWHKELEPYYPIKDKKNNALYQRYKALADTQKNVYFGGRLGQFAYLDMDKTISAAMQLASEIIFI